MSGGVAVTAVPLAIGGGHGGATTTGPDATPPQLSVKTWGGGELGEGRPEGVGGSAGGCGGGGSAGGCVCVGVFSHGGGGSQGGGGGLRTTHYYHMHTPRGGCVSGAGLGKLLVAVVKQGLQMGRCVHSGCGGLSLPNKRHLLSASSC